jgi:ribosome-binding factor A
MKKTRRTAQVGDMVRQELSQIIQRDLKDPSLTFVSILDVEVAPDLHFARVFISTLGSQEEGEEMVERLTQLKGRIRQMLGSRIHLRYTPDLEFRLDTTAARAANIERILAEVMPKGEDPTPEPEEE